jgi:hypothetical protein
MQWIEELKPEKNRQTALASAAGFYGGTDPKLAGEFALRISDETQRIYAFRSIGSRSVSRPELGLTWLKTLPPGTNYVTALFAALSALAQQQPDQAMNYATNVVDVNLL